MMIDLDFAFLKRPLHERIPYIEKLKSKRFSIKEFYHDRIKLFWNEFKEDFMLVFLLSGFVGLLAWIFHIAFVKN